MRTRAIAVFAGGLLATAATAQTIPDVGLVIDVENPELMPGQSTTVTLSAAWRAPYFKMAGVATGLDISTGPEGWSDLALIAPMAGPGTTPGGLAPGGVEGILAGQLNFPPGTPYYPDPNPIPFWQATYTAPLDAASPFDIGLLTSTTRFDVYIEEQSATTVSLIDEVIEGSAAIRVIPAPASVLVLGIGIVGMSRMRRR